MDQYECSDIDMVVAQCVDEIWEVFDTDNSGSLDKDETKRFVKSTLMDMQEDNPLSDEDFEQCFREFDKNGDGEIERSEMITFIKIVSGFPSKFIKNSQQIK